VSEARLLQLLEAEMAELATTALEQPAARDAFEYGRVVGMHAGLKRAFEIIGNAYEEEEKRGFNL